MYSHQGKNYQCPKVQFSQIYRMKLEDETLKCFCLKAPQDVIQIFFLREN